LVGVLEDRPCAICKGVQVGYGRVVIILWPARSLIGQLCDLAGCNHIQKLYGLLQMAYLTRKPSSGLCIGLSVLTSCLSVQSELLDTEGPDFAILGSKDSFTYKHARSPKTKTVKVSNLRIWEFVLIPSRRRGGGAAQYREK